MAIGILPDNGNEPELMNQAKFQGFVAASLKDLQRQIADVYDVTKNMRTCVALHDTDIAVLKSSQKNLHEWQEALKEAVENNAKQTAALTAANRRSLAIILGSAITAAGAVLVAIIGMVG